MKASQVFALTAVLALVGGLALAADESTATPSDRGAGMSGMTGMSGQMNLQKSQDIIGQDIKSSSGEKLGKVDDLVLSSDHKRVAYVISSSGGVAGIGTKYYAIPWSAVQAKSGEKGLTLNITKDKFNSAPSFEKKNWPDLNSAEERSRLNSFYGTSGTGETPSGSGFSGSLDSGTTEKPSGTATPSDSNQPSGSGYSGSSDTGNTEKNTGSTEKPSGDSGSVSPSESRRDTIRGRLMERRGGLAKVTDINGTDVKNSKGESLGEIENLMIDTSSGRIAYAVVGYGGVVGIGEKYVAVPWQSVQYAPSQSVAMVNIDKPTFESLAFSSDKWPDLASTEYQQKIEGKFSAAPTGQVYGFVSPTGEQRTSPWNQDSRYNKMFKADQVTKVEGTIQSVGTFRPAPGAEPGLRLRIQSSDGQPMIVHAGPAAFAQEKGITFNQGDKITVNGSKVQFNNRTILMARDIEVNGKTLTLRDEKGNVQWKTEELMKGREMDQGKTGETGTPSDSSTTPPETGTPSTPGGTDSGTPSGTPGGTTGTPGGAGTGTPGGSSSGS